MSIRILSINISKKRGEKKIPVERAILIKDYGIEGDIHAGSPIRQVSLLSTNDIDRIKKMGLDIQFGDFAENITAQGIDIEKIKIGDVLRINNVRLEVTQIGKECHSRCNIYKLAGYCVMPEAGIFMRVIEGGEIRVGDHIEIISTIREPK